MQRWGVRSPPIRRARWLAVLPLLLATLLPPPASAVPPGADGDLIFVGAVDHDVGLFRVTSQGSAPTLLSEDTNIGDLRVSPDGRKVLFHSTWKVDGRYVSGLVVLDIATGKSRRLTNEDEAGEQVVDVAALWSPDGQHVLFVRLQYLRNATLYRIRADGTDLRRVRNAERPVAADTFTPDGRFMLYRDHPEGAGRFDDVELYRARLDGTGRQRLTDNRVDEGRVSVSPDGRRVAFSALAPGRGTEVDMAIHTMRLDGSDLRVLTEAYDSSGERYSDTYDPRWSPSGQQIMFLRNGGSSDVRGQVWVMDAEGGDQRRLRVPVGAREVVRAARPATCLGRHVTIRGTSGDDVLRGTPYDDVVATGDGDDVVRGLEGDDVVCGGYGSDRLVGGSGDDVLDGGRGPDRLWGSGGSDRLRARDGARDLRLSCGSGADRSPRVDVRLDPRATSCR